MHLGMARRLARSDDLIIREDMDPRTMHISLSGDEDQHLKWKQIHGLTWENGVRTPDYVLLKVYMCNDGEDSAPHCKMLLYPYSNITLEGNDAIAIEGMPFAREGDVWLHRSNIAANKLTDEAWSTKFVHLNVMVNNKTAPQSSGFDSWVKEVQSTKFIEVISPEYLRREHPLSIYATLGPQASHDYPYLYVTVRDQLRYSEVVQTMVQPEAQPDHMPLKRQKLCGGLGATEPTVPAAVGNSERTAPRRGAKGRGRSRCTPAARPIEATPRAPRPPQSAHAVGTFSINMEDMQQILCYDPWDMHQGGDVDCCRHIGLEVLFWLSSQFRGREDCTDGTLESVRKMVLHVVSPLLQWAIHYVQSPVAVPGGEDGRDVPQLLALLKPLHDRPDPPRVRTLGDMLRASYAMIDSSASDAGHPTMRKMKWYWFYLRDSMIRERPIDEDSVVKMAAEADESSKGPFMELSPRPPQRDGGSRPQSRAAGYYDPEHAPRTQLGSFQAEARLRSGEWWRHIPHFEPKAERLTLCDAVLALGIEERGSGDEIGDEIGATFGDVRGNRIIVAVINQAEGTILVRSHQGGARRSTVVKRRDRGDRRPRCWIGALNGTTQHTPPGAWYDYHLARLHDQVADQVAKFDLDTPWKDAARWSLLVTSWHMLGTNACAWSPVLREPNGPPPLPEVAHQPPSKEVFQCIAMVSAELHEEREWPCDENCNHENGTGFFDMACKNTFGVWISSPPRCTGASSWGAEFLLAMTAPPACPRYAGRPITRLGYCRFECDLHCAPPHVKVSFRREDGTPEGAWKCHIFKRFVGKTCTPAVLTAFAGWMGDVPKQDDAMHVDARSAKFREFMRVVARSLMGRGR